MRKVYRLFLFVKLFLQYGSFVIARCFSKNLSNFGYYNARKLICRNDAIQFENCSNSIQVNQLGLFRYDLAQVVFFLEKFAIRSNGTDAVALEVESREQRLNLQATSYETLYAIREIFHEEIYNIGTDEQLIVVDIGMNIGLASLYFSCYPNVSAVYGYEPFLETFKLAEKTIQSNLNAAEKVSLVNAGLGSKNSELTVPSLAPGHLGASTTDFVISAFGSSEEHKVSIKILDAAFEFKRILKHNNGKKIVLKMDCEGAEYEIMQHLRGQGLIDSLSIAMIEWHYRGAKPILDMFPSDKFQYVCINNRDFEAGMIYLFRRDGI